MEDLFYANAAFVYDAYRKYGTAASVLCEDLAEALVPDFRTAEKDGENLVEVLSELGERAESGLPLPGEKERFALAFSRRTELSITSFFPLVPEGKPLRVLYTRVGASDRVYRAFASLLSDARVEYTPNNNTAAEAVEAGDGDFLLLPYADAAGNRVPSAQSLADLHGLYLSALISVRVGEDDLLYGAYGRAVLPPNEGSTTLLLQIPDADATGLGSLFSLAGTLGLVPGGIRTLPGSDTTEIALTGHPSALHPVAVFASLFFVGTTFTGLYAGEAITADD